MFVVAVLYDLHPERREEFRAAILKNAAASQRDEPGCLQFDVSFSEDGAHCFLYEVYADSNAFAVHRTTPHFQEYFAKIGDWVANKRVETFTRANNNG